MRHRRQGRNPFNAPIVLMLVKDGGVSLCVTLRVTLRVSTMRTLNKECCYTLPGQLATANIFK